MAVPTLLFKLCCTAKVDVGPGGYPRGVSIPGENAGTSLICSGMTIFKGSVLARLGVI
jgi:hypothetical protein